MHKNSCTRSWESLTWLIHQDEHFFVQQSIAKNYGELVECPRCVKIWENCYWQLFSKTWSKLCLLAFSTSFTHKHLTVAQCLQLFTWLLHSNNTVAAMQQHAHLAFLAFPWEWHNWLHPLFDTCASRQLACGFWSIDSCCFKTYAKVSNLSLMHLPNKGNLVCNWCQTLQSYITFQSDKINSWERHKM